MSRNTDRIEFELNNKGSSNDPFASAVRSTRMPMLITDPRRPDNPIVFINDAFTKLTGYTRAEVLGRNCRFLQGAATNPDDVTRLRNAVARREPIETDLINYRKDGTSFWNRLLISPVFDDSGDLIYFFASQFDVSPDRNRVKELQLSHEELENEIERRMLDISAADARLRFILEAGGLGVWTLDLKTQRLVASARFKSIFGRAPGDTFDHSDLITAITDTDVWETAVAEAEASGEEMVVECQLRTPTEETRWVELRGQVNRDVVDTAAIMTGVALDITTRKETEEHRKLLSRELNHRVKNTLATVQAVFLQSLRASDTIKDAEERVMGRMQALSNAQDLLTQEGWSSATLRDVVDRSLAPFKSFNIRIGGPRITLGARAVSALSLALHELATNSIKYGALSAESGAVAISWNIEPGEEPMLHFHWSELGGPPVSPPTRRGFGSRVIVQTVEAELKGEAQIEYAPSGIQYEVAAPISALVADIEAEGGGTY
ncbi:PAS domain S-box-containing protein [Devosia crocina]|uniref:Blue-light-activated histidine kinase n=1 Tax=Devosia crocina TaxID=429728 RepID=A0A1I7NDL3_9HYPH|nr:PAS domain-containing protein [Devosia crocina]SFV32721.1 PAS domain S-box-containing protein [Devosia crocina]